MTSSPGYPYQREAPTNGQWLKYDGIMCDSIQLERLWYDVQLVLTDKWDTVLRMFIKQEPHKISKVKENRWRLIMAAPLCVQIAWHMLFDYQNDKEIQESYNIPSQQGMILVNGGWTLYKRQWEGKGLTCGLDKSSWDWTAPFWTIKLDLDFRKRMGRGANIEEWFKIANILYQHMFIDPIMMTSEGYCYKQFVPGVMKSGCVNTISTNSHCQMMLHLAMCIENSIPIEPMPVACGDDTLQHEKHTQDLSLYEKYGVIIKEVSDTMEFMGHTFTDDGPYPLYIKKHLKKVSYVKEEDLSQYLDSMARMYCHTEYYRFWEVLAERLNHPLPLSRTAYLYWYDNSV